MIIDFHTHMFPDRLASSTIEKLSRLSNIRPHTDATAAGLISSMDEAGIDISVVLPVATAARQVEHINDASARLFEETGGRLLSFGCMHPEFPHVREELIRIKTLGLPGIKIHPVYQEVDIDDIRFLRILDCAAELGLIVVTHSGYDIGFPGAGNSLPKKCRRAVDAVGPFNFVLAHMGGWRCWEETADYLAGTGVYIDTAFSLGAVDPLEAPLGECAPLSERGSSEDAAMQIDRDLALLNEEGALHVIRAFGVDHVLFATDSPWGGQKESLSFLRRLPLTGSEFESILGGNAAELLGLS